MRTLRRNTRKQKQQNGEERVVNKKETFNKEYKLDWYQPKGKQLDIQVAMDLQELVVVNSPSGTGKCFARDTEVLLYDGTISKVQDIKVGDKLLGVDGTCRNVVETHKGKDKLYKVHQVKGLDYVVNSKHILSLVSRRFIKPLNLQKGDILNISVEDYLNLTKNMQNGLKGYVPDVMQFSKTNLNIDPYVLGLWLGDGTTSKPDICFAKKDLNIKDYFIGYLETKGYKHIVSPSYDRVGSITLSAYGGFYKELKSYNLINNKHIPHDFLFGSVEDRLELLAGIIDTDGYLDKSGIIDLIVKTDTLCENIMFLCRTLGIKVKHSVQFKKCQNFEGGYYNRLTLSGDLSLIPTKVVRKTAAERKQVKDHKVTGVRVEPEGFGDYFGFEVDGDHLFLLKDFTVVHNSSTIIHKALKDYKNGVYRKIILIKTPSEATDDALGFLTGDKNQKLEAHMHSMKSLFLQFISLNKLENDIASGNIVFDVPNYLLGATLDDSLIILEEAQTMSPNTVKLCAERAGKRSKVVIAGDSAQRYSVKKREDGLADLIKRTTYENYGVLFPNHPDKVAYIEMTSAENMRSNLSRYITDIYKD